MKQAARSKPQRKAVNRLPKIHPPKPAPMGSNREGYAGPAVWPLPKRWSPK